MIARRTFRRNSWKLTAHGRWQVQEILILSLLTLLASFAITALWAYTAAAYGALESIDFDILVDLMEGGGG